MLDPQYFKHMRPEMQEFVPAQRRRVLDIGCSEGRFSASLPGVEERWGIEPSPAARDARTRLDRVFESTFEEAQPDLPLKYFDVVVCNDVIEHMPDHARFLRDIQHHIAPGGMLVGSVPNVRYYENLFQFLLEKDWHYRDHGILDRTHMAFFTEKSLRHTLERSGFKVVAMRGINSVRWPGGSGRSRLYAAAAHGLSALSFGYFSDVLHLQFGFQAIPERAAMEAAPDAETTVSR